MKENRGCPGFLLCVDLGRLCLRRLRHRCVRQADRRLGNGPIDGHLAGARCVLEQALHARGDCDGLIHHSDRGVQYLLIRYTQRLTDAGIDGSVGSTGNSYDNALAETIIGLYKTEVIRHQGPWREASPIEYATLTWVDWLNHRRVLGSIGHVPPAELEAAYYQQLADQAIAA